MNKNTKPELKKRIRLKYFDYKGMYRYFVTICTDKTVGQCFSIANKELINNILNHLKDVAEQYKFKVWAYCFMPDHLHLLVEGETEFSDFRKFISLFKQKTGYYYKQVYKKTLWQINYYEHILRKDEDTKSVMKYIFENPVRRKLVNEFTEWPLLGSFVCDIKDLMQT